MTDTFNGEPYDDDNGGWDMTEPRERDLSGNIIDGAYADGQTTIVSRDSAYPYDDWKAAYDGLQRIFTVVDERSPFFNQHSDLAQQVMGMILTLRKQLG